MERQWTPRNTTIEGPHWKCPSSPKPHTPRQQRERAGASIGSDHQKPSRTARKQHPPPSLPARAGPFPRPLTQTHAKKIHVSSESRVPQRRSHQAHDLPAVEQDPPRCPPWQHPSLQNCGLTQPTDRGLRSIWQYKNTRSPEPDNPSRGRPINRAHFGGRRQRIPPRAHCTDHRLWVLGGQCRGRRTSHPFSLRGVPVGAAHHLVWFTRRIRSRSPHSSSREHDSPP